MIGLISIQASFADQRPRALELLNQLKSTTSLAAEFEQTVRGEGNRIISESKGKFVFKRPGRFRWDYVAPFEQMIMADGDTIWMYDIDLEQISVRQQKAALSGTPALLLSGGVDIAKHFFIEFEMTDRGGVEWVRLLPKQDEATFTKVMLGFKDGTLNQMKMIDHFNQITLFVFSKITLNADVDDTLFLFVPPKGVDVIRAE